MSDHEKITIENLLADKTFRDWVTSGNFKKTPFEWKNDGASDPDFDNVVRQAIDIVLVSRYDEQVDDENTEVILSAVYRKIWRHERRQRYYRWGSVAAALILIGSFVIWRNRPMLVNTEGLYSSKEQVSPNWEKFENNGTSNRLRILPDGSSVVLLPQSQIMYSIGSIDSLRRIQLKGTAYFEVAKNKERPFEVESAGLVVHVTGTSFAIKAPGPQQNVELAVHSGTVEVYPEQGDPATLSANRQIVFDRKTHKIESTRALGWMIAMKQVFQTDFEEVPLLAILKSLELAYGVEVIYDRKILESCVVTTSLYDLPLPKKLNLLAASLGDGNKFEIQDDQRILFKGPGCKSFN